MQGNTESETDIEHEPETDNEFTMKKWQRIYRRENMKAELKLQIDAVKNGNILYADAGIDNFVFLTDGHYGAYIRKNQVRIDLSKCKKIKLEEDTDFNNILKISYPARETKTAFLAGNDFCIKIKTEDTYCFVKEKYLKMFPGYNTIRISDKDKAVLIMRSGDPYGLIMPMKISEELE